jgi:hypothetical protein
MIPQNLPTLFWDVNVDSFDPSVYASYTITRILEYGDEQAVAWMRQTFSEEEIKQVVRTERRLSRKSANFWALVYDLPPEQVAALSRAT